MDVLYTKHFMLCDLANGIVNVDEEKETVDVDKGTVTVRHISFNCPFREPFLIKYWIEKEKETPEKPAKWVADKIKNDDDDEDNNLWVFQIGDDYYYINETHNLEYDSASITLIDSENVFDNSYNLNYEIRHTQIDGINPIIFNKDCLPPETLITITYAIAGGGTGEGSGEDDENNPNTQSSNRISLENYGKITLSTGNKTEFEEKYIYNCDLDNLEDYIEYIDKYIENNISTEILRLLKKLIEISLDNNISSEILKLIKDLIKTSLNGQKGSVAILYLIKDLIEASEDTSDVYSTILSLTEDLVSVISEETNSSNQNQS